MAYQKVFQDPATALMVGLIDLHHQIMTYLIFVALGVLYLLILSLYLSLGSEVEVGPYSSLRASLFRHPGLRVGRKDMAILPTDREFVASLPLETLWTLLPALILIGIALPSLSLLYATEELLQPEGTVKIIGRQWYWSVEYENRWLNQFEGTSPEKEALPATYSFDMTLSSDAEVGSAPTHRLLDVDNRILLPPHTLLRLVITASDVIHSFTIPSFGIKVDGIPGRLNQVITSILRPGVFYGQCSELCGVGHSAMPISIEVTKTPRSYALHLSSLFS